MASSDSFVIYIRSSRYFNFAVLASSDDDISSLKKKAEAQHLALFPQNGRIVAQAIKITHEETVYSLPDNIPVRSLFDVDGANRGIRLLFMDAVVVSPDSAETHTHVLDLCQNGDPSRGRDRDCSLNQDQGGNYNTNCPFLNKDPVVEEMTTPGVGVGVLGEGNSSKQKKSKEGEGHPSSSSDDDEAHLPVPVWRNQNRNIQRQEETMQERSGSAAPENENETAGIHLVTWNPEAASADVVLLDAAAPGGNADGSYNVKENRLAWVKEARKEVGYNTRSTTNADVSGETSSFAPSSSDLRDKGTVTPDNQIKDNDNISAPDSSIAASVKKRRRTRERQNVPSSPPIRERENESEISEEDASKKKRKQDATQQLEHTLSEKEKFVSKDHLRAAVNEFHKHKNIEVKWTQSNRRLVVVQCKNSRCKWRLYAKAQGVGLQSPWVIRKCRTPHTCR